MRHTVLLVGGGPSALVQTRRHFKTALSALPVRRPLVAYVGAASGDNLAFRKMISLALAPARVEAANLVARRASTAAARQVLDDADLVFVSGGDVDAGMEVLRARGVDSHLRALAEGGKPMLGVSAGSIMLAREWVRFPDEGSDHGAELFACLGIAPVHVDCHSEDDGWSELRTLVRLRHQRGDADPGAIGLPSKGALRLELDGKPRLSALGVPLPRLKIRGGDVVDDRALEPA